MLMSHPSPGLVWAFRIRADGTAEELDVDQPLGDYPDGWLWLHFNLVEAPACAFLKSLPDLPPAAIDAMVQRHHHLQLHVGAACVYGVIADLCCTLSGVEDQFGFLHFVMTERYLITGRRRALNAVEATRQALQNGQRVATAASLFELIIEHVAQAIDNLAGEIALEMDQIEERILDSDTGDHRQKLGILRRKAVPMHRQLSGLRTLFHRLERSGSGDLKPPLRLAAGRLSQRLDGLDHEIEALRERARVLQEEIAHQLAEESNRHLHVLTVVTILFLPPTLIAGLFGMNLHGLPFSESDSGFWAGVIAALISSAAVYAVLRWLGIRSL
ncbi:MAG: transporter [Rhodoplanes sp.]